MPELADLLRSAPILTTMPRPPLLRTLFALLPVIGAMLAALAGARAWPTAVTLLAMLVTASAAAVIYWSAPLQPAAAQSDAPETTAESATVADAISAVADAIPAEMPAAESALIDAEAEPEGDQPERIEAGSTGTRAERLAGKRMEEDLLTGLLAPESFFERFTAELERCGVAGHTAILVICDLDDFGELNRTAGLVDANRLLRGVADCLRLTVREGDLLGRLGGDEFALFFPGLPPEIAESRVRDLRAAVREAASLTLAEESHRVTISVGMSCYPRDGQNGADLIEVADLALQAAKQQRASQADRLPRAAMVVSRS